LCRSRNGAQVQGQLIRAGHPCGARWAASARRPRTLPGQARAGCVCGNAPVGTLVRRLTAMHTGLAVITDTEDRQHTYVALTHGTTTNMAYVFTVSPSSSSSPVPHGIRHGEGRCVARGYYPRLAAWHAGRPARTNLYSRSLPEALALHRFQQTPARFPAGSPSW
jgi:hypothetical protein